MHYGIHCSVNATGLKNFFKQEALTQISQNFVGDQVHLTNELSKMYMKSLHYDADNLFRAEVIDLEEGTSKKGKDKCETRRSKTESRFREKCEEP